MKKICQLYMPAFYRSFGKNAVKEATGLLPSLKKTGFSGIYLISLWEDGGYDNIDIRDDRVQWFFSLAAGGEKRFSVKLRAAYEGRFVLPEISCQAMYEPSVAANTASGTAEVVR